ncbi:hypothetical protein B0H10DRAFT_30048 [Mycena sp. CBHHK59/15]|nr:hypothetical protein B0H10DRAFT_30048 [Mycena sp. CBHHK59/15]
MATPAPPVPASTSSRTRDWVRTSEPGSAFSGLGRGGRGAGRGRSRGGRGRGGGGGGSASRTPSTVEKPAASEGSTSKAASSGSAPAEKSSTSPATPARSKGHGRKSSRSVVPTVVVGPSTPATEAPPAAARPSNRRRRSQQLNSKGSSPGLKVNVPASLDDNLLRPQNRLVPHSAPPPSKDTPPHLVGSFDMRNNIDALVERVRAVAMDNRPSTPGSHIDWAGDDDEGLPDLDDWGVTTGTSVGDKDEMISPIIVDGLKPLPEPVAKPPTPSGDRKEEIPVPFVMEDQQKFPETGKAPLHPSLPQKPVTISPGGRGKGAAAQTASLKPTVDSAEIPVLASAVPELYKVPANDIAQQPVLEVSAEKQEKDDASSDSGREGLAASIHAPSLSNSLSAPSNLSTPPTQPRNFNPTHNRAHTVGRAPHFPQSAPVNFNPRFSRSGTSTPRGGFSPGGQHARTHSSPPAGSMLSNHRPPHARPVITGDAISRLARTIAAPSARTPPIPTSNV